MEMKRHDMDIKALRKGMKELKEHKFPWRHDYHYGFHYAIELCSKLIENQIRKDRRKKNKGDYEKYE